jgi:hypothetical protein
MSNASSRRTDAGSLPIFFHRKSAIASSLNRRIGFCAPFNLGFAQNGRRAISLMTWPDGLVSA